MNQTNLILLIYLLTTVSSFLFGLLVGVTYV